ncbi:MAG: prepilin-type N-terminal cleavage/methylation domain-containing protein [Deltaproteobacteria bacterium]|nr:prepilin-type N-terminal cleavage/methylation domain-containing protein [Deltaproteobacteria bacterium]
MPGNAQSGFTLLEVMAALAILGIGIVMVIQLFSGGLGLAKASDDYTRKVLVAKEKMADTLLTEKLKEGVTKGVTEDGFSWAVEISQYDLKKTGDGANARIFKVVVSAGGPGALKNSFTLTTLKTVF